MSFENIRKLSYYDRDIIGDLTQKNDFKNVLTVNLPYFLKIKF